MAASNVDLVEMADTSVARGDGDVFELDVHVVFGCVVRGFSVSWEIEQATVVHHGEILLKRLCRGRKAYLLSISHGRPDRM